jgi:hypothetical protein
LLLLPATVAAYPAYNGDQSFSEIPGPEGPEDYAWEVELGEGQELRQVDETHAAIFYEDGTEAFSIEAIAAHDAEGTTVPTTIAVTQPNVITLTVHHRAGQPLAGGAPFDYPVVAGEGWEGGFKTEPAVIVSPDHQGPPTPPTCVVPDLTGRTLRASRKMLHHAHCRLGAVRGEQIRTAHVVSQYRQVGRSLPLWTRVDVKALRGFQYSRSS